METTSMQHISSKLTLIHEDLQELINITRSRNDINVSQIVDTLKRELNISFNIVEEQPFPNSQDQIRTILCRIYLISENQSCHCGNVN